MTPKQKAALIVLQYMSKVVSMKLAKQCAIISVDEIIDSRFAITESQLDYQYYWNQVKQEINNL